MNPTFNIDAKIFKLDIRDELTFECYAAMKNALEAVAGQDITGIVVDMGSVEYVDSAGLGLLLLLNEAAAKKHVRPVITGAHGPIERLFKLAKFATYFDFA